ncbi:unnamed protein product [Trichogramma brassicae]|uniref:Uncharacterized protein n=1 Tax=Trichogramma brassicae TaxID=86971 RepID=A0A6H5IJ10_9HYME|nr:unnamed protein product [Trichogramma brassicae]
MLLFQNPLSPILLKKIASLCGGIYRALAWASAAAFRLVSICAYKRTRSMRTYTCMCKGIYTYLVYTLYAMKLLDCLCRRRTRRCAAKPLVSLLLLLLLLHLDNLITAAAYTRIATFCKRRSTSCAAAYVLGSIDRVAGTACCMQLYVYVVVLRNIRRSRAPRIAAVPHIAACAKCAVCRCVYVYSLDRKGISNINARARARASPRLRYASLRLRRDRLYSVIHTHANSPILKVRPYTSARVYTTIAVQQFRASRYSVSSLMRARPFKLEFCLRELKHIHFETRLESIYSFSQLLHAEEEPGLVLDEQRARLFLSFSTRCALEEQLLLYQVIEARRSELISESSDWPNGAKMRKFILYLKIKLAKTKPKQCTSPETQRIDLRGLAGAGESPSNAILIQDIRAMKKLHRGERPAMKEVAQSSVTPKPRERKRAKPLGRARKSRLSSRIKGQKARRLRARSELRRTRRTRDAFVCMKELSNNFVWAIISADDLMAREALRAAQELMPHATVPPRYCLPASQPSEALETRL